MNGFLNFLLHFIFIVTFLFLYVVSIIILRPFRFHRKRPYSTIIFKSSYLAYLAVFLSLAYLVLFFSASETIEGDEDSILFKIYYGITIFSFIVPNLSIMFRRKIKRLRRSYNIIFSIVNFLVIIALIFIIWSVQWEF